MVGPSEPGKSVNTAPLSTAQSGFQSDSTSPASCELHRHGVFVAVNGYELCFGRLAPSMMKSVHRQPRVQVIRSSARRSKGTSPVLP